MTTSTLPPSYPVRVTARLDSPLSRWLWLVKWFLAIPHYIVLAFLWLGFIVLSIGAFFAILFTSRYPRGIFDFNVGVLRWTWRVQYYTYGALATDRYPPFTLADVPDYPARLEVAYPQHLSRGLVLVKWWLLAIPHYIIVGLFIGGGSWLAFRLGTDNVNWAGGGLIGLLVLVAAVILAVTGRYPQPLFDFVLGLDRWVLRVAAYAGLMTDEYPPFRLDMGGDESGSTSILTKPAPPPYDGGAEPGQGSQPGQSAQSSAKGWTTGRVIAVVAGSVLLLASLGLFAGGGAVLWADQHRDAGYVTSGQQRYTSDGYAITTERISLGEPAWSADWQSDVLGKLRIRATGHDSPIFVGIGPSHEVDQYLNGVGHTRLNDLGHHHGTGVKGGPPARLPATQNFWAASSAGAGEQTVVWPVRGGDWVIVAMNADGSPGLNIDADAGATVPVLPWVAAGLLLAGGVLLAAGVVLVVVPVRRAGRQSPPAQAQPLPAGPQHSLDDQPSDAAEPDRES